MATIMQKQISEGELMNAMPLTTSRIDELDNTLQAMKRSMEETNDKHEELANEVEAGHKIINETIKLIGAKEERDINYICDLINKHNNIILSVKHSNLETKDKLNALAMCFWITNVVWLGAFAIVIAVFMI